MHQLARPLFALATLALLQSCAAQLDGATMPNPCSELTIENSRRPIGGKGRIETVKISYHEKGTDRKILLPEMKHYGTLLQSSIRACNTRRAPFLFQYEKQAQVDCNMLDSPRCEHGLEINIEQLYWIPILPVTTYKPPL